MLTYFDWTPPGTITDDTAKAKWNVSLASASFILSTIYRLECFTQMMTNWESPFSRFPTVHGIEWFNLGVLVCTPLVALWGILHIPMQRPTVILALIHFFVTMIG
jgi:hypothetical protein